MDVTGWNLKIGEPQAQNDGLGHSPTSPLDVDDRVLPPDH